MMQYSDDEFWGEGGIREKIDDKVDMHIEANRKCYPLKDSGYGYRNFIIYSAWDTIQVSENEIQYYDNIDDVAVTGRVQFRTDFEDFFGSTPLGERKNYVSEVVEDPTWLDLALLANDMINCTGDNHHVFLEGIEKTGQFFTEEEGFVIIYEFIMGS